MLSVIQPPNSGPITGATRVVIAQMASAVPALAFEKLDSSNACDSGIMGPATAPCRTRKAISSCRDLDQPQSSEAIENKTIDAVKRRTAPKRWLSQPVNGTAIALATPKEVITHVTCVVDTPRSPPIDESDTFAIDVSSTFMNVASASDTVPRILAAPVRGANSSAAAMPHGAAAAGTSPLSAAYCVE